jgi:hypothetical protein
MLTYEDWLHDDQRRKVGNIGGRLGYLAKKKVKVASEQYPNRT